MGEILLAGVDALAVGFSVQEFRLTPEEWEQLKDAKANAQGTMFDSGGTPMELRGQRFSMSGKGSRGYEYVLMNDDVTVQLAERAAGGAVYPEIRVTWRSSYLWRYGWRAAYIRVRDWVYGWAVVKGKKVSRADATIDVNRALPEVNLRAGEVISYAQKKKEFYIQHHLTGLSETGYSFGQGDLMCRVYDKRIEIEHSQKAWFMDLWRKAGWNGESSVTRVEFQMRRDFLRSMQIETVKDLNQSQSGIYIDTGLGSTANTVIPANAGIQGTL